MTPTGRIELNESGEMRFISGTMMEISGFSHKSGDDSGAYGERQEQTCDKGVCEASLVILPLKSTNDDEHCDR